VIGVLGHGNVSKGVQEVLGLLKSKSIHPRDMKDFAWHERRDHKDIFHMIFLREEKLRSKDGNNFYFEEYLKNPDGFESNLDHYLPYMTLLFNCSYWDKRFPRLVPEAMLQKLFRSHSKPKLSLIGDLSCDVEGTIEITKKVTTPEDPVFIYNPKTGKVMEGYEGAGVAVLAVDNLPCEMSTDASRDFSDQIRDYLYQIATHTALDLTEHAAIPRELRQAVITQKGKLTPDFQHLKKYLS